MTTGPAYPYPIGARVALVDCHGGNRVEGEVIDTPAAWTIRVDTGRTVYLAAVGLVVERLDDGAREISGASHEAEEIAGVPPMSIFPTNKSAPKIDTPPPAADKRGQLSLF